MWGTESYASRRAAAPASRGLPCGGPQTCCHDSGASGQPPGSPPLCRWTPSWWRFPGSEARRSFGPHPLPDGPRDCAADHVHVLDSPAGICERTDPCSAVEASQAILVTGMRYRGFWDYSSGMKSSCCNPVGKVPLNLFQLRMVLGCGLVNWVYCVLELNVTEVCDLLCQSDLIEKCYPHHPHRRFEPCSHADRLRG